MLLVDVHCHLSDKSLWDDAYEIIGRAEEAGVKAIITNGLGPDNDIQLELANRFPIVKAAIGYYPTETGPLPLDFIMENAKKITAIGEIGLDRKDNPAPTEWKRQLDNFKKMVNIASELKKPIIVHSRKAEKDVIAALSKHEHPVIMHCFGGRMSLVKEGLDRGFYFSVPPIVKTSTHFQALVQKCDISRLFTETDAPYMSPVPDKLSEPAYVKVGLEAIARIKEMTPEETSNVIFKSFMDVF